MVWQQGDLFKIPNLGCTLMAIAKQGARTFYEGQIRDKLIADLQQMGSFLTKQDFEQFRQDFDTIFNNIR